MSRLKFQLSSDQLELLLAFEESQGLAHLAKTMAKDSSVVSRNLQRIAADFPVLAKAKGRWELTPLGVQVNEQTRICLNKQIELLSVATQRMNTEATIFNNKSALIIINAQNGLLDATQEGRNNSEAERNIAKILNFWRTKNREIFHVKHVSENPGSFFFRTSTGCEILSALSPQVNESVVEKKNSSAFSETNLEAILHEKNCTSVLLVGFTANECIDASARSAVALGFKVYVVGDATASFDLRDPSGKLLKAERIHRLTLANINAFYAEVINTADVLV